MTSKQTDNRFARIRLLMGQAGLDQLENARVLVLGIGGVGSNCAEALARGGVGNLILLDQDVVDITNINRQAVAYSSTVGRPKVAVMTDIIQEINPACQVTAVQVTLTRETVADQLAALPRPDYVIDCIDHVPSKVAIAQWCQAQGLPLLAAMGAGNKLDPQHLRFADIYDTYNCPLSRALRAKYRQAGIEKLTVIFSDELPVKIQDPASSAKEHTLGTMSYMPPIMGMMMAGKVIRQILNLDASQGGRG